MKTIVRFLLLLSFSFSSLFATVVLNDHTNTYTDLEILYFHDQTSSLDIDDITKAKFEPIPSQFALGYRDGNGWFKITLTNQSSQSRFVLSFTEPFWNHFDLFEPFYGSWKRSENGLLVPLEERSIQDLSPAFMITIQPGETKSFFIKGESESSHIGAFKLYTESEFFRPSRITLNTFYLFYTGILFIIVILNLFLWVEMKERIYGYYIGYVSAFIVFISMFSGSYLVFGIPGLSHGLHISGAIVLIFMALFSSEFFQLQKYYTVMAKIFHIIILIFGLFALAIYMNVPYANLAFNMYSSLFITLLLYLAVKTLAEGKIQTRYYLIALIIYMPSIGMMVLTFNTLLANTDVTRYSFLLGSIIEIILFSFILVNKFHKAKDDKIVLQKTILKQKQKHQEHLENEIAHQRLELSQKNAILSHQSKLAGMGEIIELIAHQWRQPLNVLALINQDFYVRFNLGTLDRTYFESSHKQIDEYLQYMSKTIDDFRSFYKNDRTTQLENVEDIVHAALHLSQIFLDYAHIKTNLSIEPSIKIHVVKNDLIQVMINLIKNSHDALVQKQIPNGTITISVIQNPESVMIDVCDNAGGIAKNIQERIFEPYFTTKLDHGTGLGLYMSKNIIEQALHGTLTFKNNADGVCFTITIPLVTKE